MTYLVAYLTLGAVVLVVALICHRLANPPQSDFARDILEAVNPERATFRYKLMHRLIVPALAGTLMLVAWPVAVFIKMRELATSKLAAPPAEPMQFCVTREHLLRQTSVEEIEANEVVSDPLGAVPPLPFGHLNGVWLRFKIGLAPDNALWHFSAIWDDGWGSPEILEGYVIVRIDGIGSHFLTSTRTLDSSETRES